MYELEILIGPTVPVTLGFVIPHTPIVIEFTVATVDVNVAENDTVREAFDLLT